ncbi:MAG: 5'-nucleotidase C-terminal domain-containing protein [Lachnospiraceae bacterium]|nr:5'-nucleotidase C-terminal domain-containing protein [Lachnospiraceae bacterium]
MRIGKRRSFLWYMALIGSLAVLLSLICVSDAVSAGRTGEETVELRLIFTTDIHGQLTGYNYETGTEFAGGLARLYGVIDEARQEAGIGNYLTFDLGDVLYDVATEYVISQDPEVLQPIYQAMSMIGYDAITLGNHDFDYGYDYILNQLESSGLIELSVVSNVTDSKTGEHPFGGSKILEKKLTTESGQKVTVKVGIIGETIPKLSSKTESYTGILKTEDIVANVTAEAARLKEEGADIVVVLSHSGFGPEEPEENYKNVSYALTKIDDVDVILCGHEHNTFPDTSLTSNYYDLPGVDKETGLVNGKTIIMANDRAKSIGIADLTFTVDANGNVALGGSRSEVRKADSSDPENEFLAGLFKDWDEDLKQYCEEIIAEVDSGNPLQNYFGLFEDTAAVQLMNDAKRSYAMKYIRTSKPQYADLPIIAVSTYGSYGEDGADDYSDISGEITEAGLGALQSYNTYVNIYKITGRQLKEWLEWSASAYEKIGGETSWSSEEMLWLMEETDLQPLIKQEWMEVWSNFFVFDGVDYTMNPSISERYDLAGNQIDSTYRVSNIMVNGQAVTDDMEFIIVTNRITKPKDATAWADTQLVYGGYNRSQVIVADYIQLLAKSGSVSVTPDNNWRLKLPENYRFLVSASARAVEYAANDSWNQGFLLAAGEYDYYKGAISYSQSDTVGPNIVVSPMVTGPTRTSYDVLVDASDASEIVSLRYQLGEVDADDITWNIAREITDGSFPVYFNGIYTIRAEDAKGNRSVFKLTVDNIGTDVLGTPTVETYTNRKTSIKGTAELGTVVKIETPEGVYETKTTSLGTFSYKLPAQKSGTVIYVYAEDPDTGRVSEKVKIRVKRTGPEKPSANKYYNNSTYLTGNTNDDDGEIIVIADEIVYVPENGGRELFEACTELYDEKYEIIEVAFRVDDEGNYTMNLPVQKIGTTLKVYNLDHLSRKSISVSVKVAEGGPYPPEIYDLTNIEKSITGYVNAVGSNKVYTVYAVVNGNVYSTETNQSGEFLLEFPNEQLNTGDRIVMYSTDVKSKTTRRSGNAVYTVQNIDDFLEKSSSIKISDVNYSSKRVSGTYKANQELFVSLPTQQGNYLYEVKAESNGYYALMVPEDITLLPGGYVYAMSRYEDGGIIAASASYVALPKPNVPSFFETPDNSMGVIQVVGDRYTERMVLKVGKKEYSLEEFETEEGTGNRIFTFATGQIASGTKLTAYAENSTAESKSATAVVMKLAPDAPKVEEVLAGAKTITGTVEILAPAPEDAETADEEKEAVKSDESDEADTDAEEESEAAEEAESAEEPKPEKKASRTLEEKMTDEEKEELFALSETRIFAKVGKVTYGGTVEKDGSFEITVPKKLKEETEIIVWAQNYAGKGPETMTEVQPVSEEEEEEKNESEAENESAEDGKEQ